MQPGAPSESAEGVDWWTWEGPTQGGREGGHKARRAHKGGVYSAISGNGWWGEGVVPYRGGRHGSILVSIQRPRGGPAPYIGRDDPIPPGPSRRVVVGSIRVGLARAITGSVR